MPMRFLQPFKPVTDWSNKPMFSVNPDVLPPIYTVQGAANHASRGLRYEEHVVEVFDLRLIAVALATDKTPKQHAEEDGRIMFVKKCEDEETCGVCFESVHGKAAQITPCGHYFHSACLTPWTSGDMQGKRTCPSCRTDMYPNDMQRNRLRRIDDESDDQVLEVAESDDEGADAGSVEDMFQEWVDREGSPTSESDDDEVNEQIGQYFDELTAAIAAIAAVTTESDEEELGSDEATVRGDSDNDDADASN